MSARRPDPRPADPGHRPGEGPARSRRRGAGSSPRTEAARAAEAHLGAGSAGDDEGTILPLAAWRPGRAVEAALRHEVVTLDVPLVGHVTLPGRAHLIWYAGVATFAAFEVIDWPVALLMAAAKALSDSHHHALLREFGEALEAGA